VSVKIQSAVWEHSRATGNTLLVLLKIADNCDDQGKNAWPSLPSLARYCRCSISTIQRSVKELQALGELEVVVRGGGPKPGTRYSPNLYQVYPQGGQIDTPQRGSSLVKFGIESGHERPPRLVTAMTGDPSLDPSKNAGPVENLVDHAAHAQRCRDLLTGKGPSGEALHERAGDASAGER
jgi:DNA-binding transcriptional MocR family regulator